MKPFDILLLECSPRTDATSTRLVHRLLDALRPRIDGKVRLTERRIGAEPLPPISAAYAESLLLPIAEARERYGAELSLSDELVSELERADLLLIATPVHNFTIPAALKTWIDYVVRREVTFKSTPQGKVDLLRDRPTLVAVTSGGAMFRDPPQQPDFFRPYLHAALGVMGLNSVRFVQTTGLAFSDTPMNTVETAARAWLEEGLQQFTRTLRRETVPS
ncbi:FMN-dependent NADH-azoreductase [Cupriavidus necator]